MVNRLVTAIRSAVRDPVERRAFLARLKFLAAGTQGVQAWSLEYRSALTGKFAVPVLRLAGDAEAVVRCPHNCRAHSPLSHLYEPRFVYQIKNTVVATASGATHMCGSQSTPFFIRESIAWPFESLLAHGLEIPEVSNARVASAGPHMVFPTTRNYYHWLIEELPLVLRAHTTHPDARLLAYEAGVGDKHHAVAAHLKMELATAPLVIRLQDQVLPGRASDSFFIHPNDLVHLRDFGSAFTRSLDSSLPERPERIYVSRSKSRRPLANEDELEALLANAGFAIVHLEELPWIDQITLFQNARVIVGPHGAGLANLVFANPGSTVVELTVGYMFNRCFEWISHVAGHDYFPIEADSDPSMTAVALARKIIAEAS